MRARLLQPGSQHQLRRINGPEVCWRQCRRQIDGTPAVPQIRRFSPAAWRRTEKDPRIAAIGQEKREEDGDREIADDFAEIRSHYDTPKHPIVLAHGLLGFAELKLARGYLPGVEYWFGIKEALVSQGVKVITTTVPPTGTIEERAQQLATQIADQANGESVNIIAHSMGGLDARYMISQLKPPSVEVKSLVTVSTPHHGSAFADYVMDQIGPNYLPRLYNAYERTTGWKPGAFAQLTSQYVREEFNPKTPDNPDVRYFSYGAMLQGKPRIFSPFRRPHDVLERLDGPNDGLVSIKSAKWGEYKGTLVDVSHLDLINWTNKLRWTFRKLMGHKRTFNAVALYLDIADMLAKEGL